MNPNESRVLALALAALLLAASCTANSSPAGSPRTSPATASPPTGSPRSTATPSCNGDPTAGLSGQQWWDDRVFYEVFVRSFADSNGDGIGDLRGLTERLDYLNDGDPATADDLGVTGLWLMPIMESPSYHGYDIVDYRTVARDYGTNDDFKALVAAAHKRGIAVIVDLVLNHTSSQHPWFLDSQTPGSAHDAWYGWSNTDPGWTGPGGRTVWFQAGSRWYYAFFWEAMPDLNLTNPEVTAALDDVARFWLDEMGVDGFRLDAAQHLVEVGKAWADTPQTHEWLRDFRTFVRGVKPDPLLVGEIWNDTRTVARYGPDQVDLAFEFTLADAMLSAARNGDSTKLRDEQALVLACQPGGRYASFLSNHNQDRVMSRLDGNESAARAAAGLLLTGPGVPFIYYGEEIGMSGSNRDELIRAPMTWTAESPGVGFTTGSPWEAPSEGWESRNVATESADPSSLLAAYRSLVRLRQEHLALSAGATTPVASSHAGLYAFLRSASAESLLVIVNLGRSTLADYSLAMAEGPLRPGASSEVVLGPSVGIPAPSVAPNGAFSDYRPGLSLAPGETVVLRLGS